MRRVRLTRAVRVSLLTDALDLLNKLKRFENRSPSSFSHAMQREHLTSARHFVAQAYSRIQMLNAEEQSPKDGYGRLRKGRK